tara:strand:+ start:6773 stop:7630 length:858 start_codon:yes stop_codon:yes gene_type:complete
MSTKLDLRRNKGSMLSVPDPVTGGSVMRGTFNNPVQMNTVNAVGSNNKGVNMLPVIGGIAAGAGLLTNLFNKPQNINQDFSFDLMNSNYNMNPEMGTSIGNLNRQGSLLNDMSSRYQQTSSDFLDPNSSWMRGQRANLSQDIADNTMTQQNMLNMALAQRGVGGSISSMLNAATANRGGEQLSKGFNNIMNQGVGYAQNFANLGLNAMQAGTGAYGASGQLASAADARTLQNEQFNTQSRNDYRQYLKTANYNQTLQNQNAASAWRNNLSNNLFNLAGSAFGMGV